LAPDLVFSLGIWLSNEGCTPLLRVRERARSRRNERKEPPRQPLTAGRFEGAAYKIAQAATQVARAESRKKGRRRKFTRSGRESDGADLAGRATFVFDRQ